MPLFADHDDAESIGADRYRVRSEIPGNQAAALPFWGLRDDNGAIDGSADSEKITRQRPKRPERGKNRRHVC